MNLVRELTRRCRCIIPPTLAALVFAYFMVHLFVGDRGLYAWARLSHELAAATSVHDDVSGDRERLEMRVDLMRGNDLDPDMLEEQVRRVAGRTHADEIVILYSDRRD